MKKFLLGLLALVLLTLPGSAQQAVKQSGNVSAGHPPVWVAPGIIGDGGTAASGFLTSLGVTNNGGPGICVNSGSITGPYNQICLAATTNGGTKISSYAVNGAMSPGLQFDINGTVQNFPVFTGPAINNDLVCFNGTTGAIKDCGIAANPGVSITVPTIIGGTAANSALTLESTSGVGTTDSISFKTGSQVTRWLIDSNGNFFGLQGTFYIDPSGVFANRNSLMSLERNVPTPTSIFPSFTSIVQSKGDNATFIGASGGYFQSRDRSDVSGANKGVLYAIQASVVPQTVRNNTPFDDVVGVVISNDGTQKGTEGVYIGHNVGGGGADWAASIGIDAIGSDAAIYVSGAQTYGIDFARGPGATFSQAAIRLSNNANIVGRNSTNSADIAAIKVDASNLVSLQNGALVINPSTGVSIGTTTDAGSGNLLVNNTITAKSTIATGANGGTAGAVKFFGSTSGDVTVKVPAAAGTATNFQLPTTNGSVGNFLQTDGSGNTSWQPTNATSGARVLLNTLTASNSATLADTTSFTSTYNRYEIVFQDIISVTNSVALRLRYNVGGVQTTGYLSSQSGAQAGVANSEAQTTYIPISFAANHANTAPGLQATLTLYGDPTTTVKHQVSGLVAYRNSANQAVTLTTEGMYDTTGALTGIEVSESSGNISSGTVKIFGIVN